MSLDDTFLIDGGESSYVPNDIEVELDDTNTLDTVIRLSLNAYKSLMEDVNFIDVKDRVKHLEVADKYLKTATDAMNKKEMLMINRAKISRAPTKVEVTDDVKEPQVGTSRDELYEKRRQKLAEKG